MPIPDSQRANVTASLTELLPGVSIEKANFLALPVTPKRALAGALANQLKRDPALEFRLLHVSDHSDRAIKLACSLAFDLELNVSFDLAVVLDVLTRELSKALDRALLLAHYSATDRDLAHALASLGIILFSLAGLRGPYLLPPAGVTNPDRRTLLQMDAVIQTEVFPRVDQLLVELTPRTPEIAPFIPLIQSVSKALKCSDLVTARREVRKFLAGWQWDRKPMAEQGRGLLSFLPHRGHRTWRDDGLDLLPCLSAFLIVTLARQEGMLPAWEGIRLVRERHTIKAFQ
jgi:hypothetical protein